MFLLQPPCSPFNCLHSKRSEGMRMVIGQWKTTLATGLHSCAQCYSRMVNLAASTPYWQWPNSGPFKSQWPHSVSANNWTTKWNHDRNFTSSSACKCSCSTSKFLGLKNRFRSSTFCLCIRLTLQVFGHICEILHGEEQKQWQLNPLTHLARIFYIYEKGASVEKPRNTEVFFSRSLSEKHSGLFFSPMLCLPVATRWWQWPDNRRLKSQCLDSISTGSWTTQWNHDCNFRLPSAYEHQWRTNNHIAETQCPLSFLHALPLHWRNITNIRTHQCDLSWRRARTMII